MAGKIMKKMRAGRIAFMIGIFGAIILGLLAAFGVFEAGTMLMTVLIIAGVVIGLMNINDKESVPVMVAALVIGGGAGVLASLPWVGEALGAVLGMLSAVALPAGIVVAVKVLYNKAQ